MAKFHEFTEYAEKNFFVPVHEFIWNKYLVETNLDGQMAFYYAMEYIHDHFPKIDAKLAFEIASDIMQETWDLYYDRIEAERKAEMLEDANNYDVWEDDGLPW